MLLTRKEEKDGEGEAGKGKRERERGGGGVKMLYELYIVRVCYIHVFMHLSHMRTCTVCGHIQCMYMYNKLTGILKRVRASVPTLKKEVTTRGMP